MRPGQELLQKWDALAPGLRPRMEIFGEVSLARVDDRALKRAHGIRVLALRAMA